MSIADKLFNLKNEKSSANFKAGQAFLESNKQKPGVTTLPSGLQYEVIIEGTGIKPSSRSNVTCHYHGSLIDGTVFDSSVKRGQPATFPLNRVIAGWTEGLQLMGVGSKWRFFIPPNLAYGDRQTGSDIGPNSTLIFDVELLGVS
jgi:FKBP-type peptidyl-prolyl cis-trans isomerase FklB